MPKIIDNRNMSETNQITKSHQHLILEQLLRASLLKAQQEATKQGLAYYVI